MKKKLYRIREVQEGVVFLLLSGMLLGNSLEAYKKSYIKDWAQSPSLFPTVIAGLLAVLAVILLIKGVRTGESEGKARGGHVMQVLAILGMSILYMAVMGAVELPYMGVTVFSLTFVLSTFEIATLVFLLAMMLFMGVRSKPVLALVPPCTVVFLSVMFRTLLHVMLP